MFPKSHLVFLATLLLTTTQLSAQIATDGTLGIKTNLTGPNFQIPDNLGQQFDGNLFHSFREFNINTGQSATFTGPNTVQNILTRVTGGQRSLIDGTLRSDIPNANLYLLNPSGILFGKNARLDISGAFYASTADGVNLEGGGKFLARSPNDSVLTTAPPSAFGFLKSPPASIEIQGDTLAIRNHTYYAPNGQINVATDGNIHLEDSTLYAPNGQIKITTPGELRIVQTSQNLFKQFDINADGKLETIANLDVSGLQGGGKITLRTNSLVSEKGRIYADLWGEEGNPQEIKPQEIEILTNEKVHLTKGARITSENLSIGQGGSIKIEAHELQLEGANDEVEVVDDKSFFNSLTTIATTNYSSGQGGNIRIHSALLNMTSGLIQSAAEEKAEGDAGEINIEAHQVTLRDEAYIAANTKGTGKAGAITLKTDSLSLGFSGIYTEAVYEGGESGGAAGGDITIQARDSLYLFDYSRISTEAQGRGQQDQGGNIVITRPKFSILNRGSLITTGYQGDGGNITIQADHFIESSDSNIDASSKFGRNGAIWINASREDFAGLIPLFSPGFQTLGLSLSRCASFSKDNRSRFLITARDILPRSPEDWRTHTQWLPRRGR